jgi:aryl-alcohol dehydrogenase-like predicted oxidoreductase
MKYALLGNTGLIVSRLAFGAMTFTAGKSRRRSSGLRSRRIGRGS